LRSRDFDGRVILEWAQEPDTYISVKAPDGARTTPLSTVWKLRGLNARRGFPFYARLRFTARRTGAAADRRSRKIVASLTSNRAGGFLILSP
jgi:hypothetical protein